MATEGAEIRGQMAHQTEIQQAETKEIDVKEAVKKALAYVRGLYEGENLPNLRLEEVEFSEDAPRWLVTIGYTASERDVESNSFITALGSTTRPRRDYKIIEVDAHTGQALSMKIRDL